MQKTNRAHCAGLFVIALALLLFVKLADAVLGWVMSEEHAFPDPGNRHLIVRQNAPNLATGIRASKEYLAGADTLQTRDVTFRTDSDGFILGPTPATGPSTSCSSAAPRRNALMSTSDFDFRRSSPSF